MPSAARVPADSVDRAPHQRRDRERPESGSRRGGPWAGRERQGRQRSLGSLRSPGRRESPLPRPRSQWRRIPGAAAGAWRARRRLAAGRRSLGARRCRLGPTGSRSGPSLEHHLAEARRLDSGPFHRECLVRPSRHFAHSRALLTSGRHISREPDVIMGRRCAKTIDHGPLVSKVAETASPEPMACHADAPSRRIRSAYLARRLRGSDRMASSDQ